LRGAEISGIHVRIIMAGAAWRITGTSRSKHL
jgi:hypothetical protein